MSQQQQRGANVTGCSENTPFSYNVLFHFSKKQKLYVNDDKYCMMLIICEENIMLM